MQMVAGSLEAQSLPHSPASGRPSQVQSNNKPASLELLNAYSDILKAASTLVGADNHYILP